MGSNDKFQVVRLGSQRANTSNKILSYSHQNITIIHVFDVRKTQKRPFDRVKSDYTQVRSVCA